MPDKQTNGGESQEHYVDRIAGFLDRTKWESKRQTAIIMERLYALALKTVQAVKMAPAGSRQWARLVYQAHILINDSPLAYLPFVDEDPSLFIADKTQTIQRAMEILNDEAEISMEELVSEVTDSGIIQRWLKFQPGKSFQPPQNPYRTEFKPN